MPELSFAPAPPRAELLRQLRNRLAEALPPAVRAKVLVTPLFGHSAQDPVPGWARGAVEAARFLGALRKVLDLV